MSRRDQIKMTDAEVAAFLAEERTVICATIGPHGWPHLMPLWYVLRDASQAQPDASTSPRKTSGTEDRPVPPGATAPGTAVPGAAVPGATAPGTTVPGMTVPGMTVPGMAAPKTAALETTTPETTADRRSAPVPRIWAWTYARSQKVRNLERDPRATLQVEAAEAYAELRGVMLECDVIIHRDPDTVAQLGAEILLRNAVPRGDDPPLQLPPDALVAVNAQASKRVGLEFIERQRATWDHRKLGGGY